MSHTRPIEFKISQLRQDKIILTLTSIAVMMFAFFVVAFLPQMLIQFYYANMQLTEEPALLGYIPVASFAVAVLYSVYAAVMCLMKKMKIMKLEKELEMMGDEDGCMCGGHGDEDHHSAWMNDSSSMEMNMDTSELAEAMSPKKKVTSTSKKKVMKKRK